MKRKREIKLFEPELIKESIAESFVKLNPRVMMKNPVMFTVEIGTVIMLAITILTVVSAGSGQGTFGYNLVITILLFLTILFGNFAEAIAEARGKAQAASLRKTREDTEAKLLKEDGSIKIVSSSQLKREISLLLKQEILSQLTVK